VIDRTGNSTLVRDLAVSTAGSIGVCDQVRCCDAYCLLLARALDTRSGSVEIQWYRQADVRHFVDFAEYPCHDFRAILLQFDFGLI